MPFSADWRNGHTPEIMILDTLDTMEARAIDLLRVLEPPEGYYLAFSGGKDSIVLHEIARRSGVKFDAHYNITNVDPPELVKFIREEYPDVSMDRPKETMWELIVKRGMPPTRISRYSGDDLTEAGGRGRVVLVGIRYDESRARSKQGQVYVCKKTGRTQIKPIFYWETNEVWQYIESCGLKYPDLYREGFHRLGCVGCPMAGAAAQRAMFNRWPKIGMAYIRAFQRMVDRRKERGKPPTGNVNWDTGAEVMRWWCGWTPNNIKQIQPLGADNTSSEVTRP